MLNLMRIRRIFISNFELNKNELILSKEDTRRISKVLRLYDGDMIEIFWNSENDYLAELIKLKNSRAHLKIKEKINRIAEKEDISLAQSILKPNRMDWLIEKVSEIGLKEFHPIISEYSVLRSPKDNLENKIRRWKKIIISAIEQSNRSYIPEIKPIKEFNSAIIELNKNYDIIIFCNKAGEAVEIGSEKAKEKIRRSNNPLIFIGPEGGWSEQEIQKAAAANSFFLRYRNYILRAETAAIISLAIIKNIRGKL